MKQELELTDDQINTLKDLLHDAMEGLHKVSKVTTELKSVGEIRMHCSKTLCKIINRLADKGILDKLEI